MKFIKKNIFYFSFILIIFLVDRTTKLLILRKSQNLDYLDIPISSFLNLNLVWNKGIAFGLFSFNQNNLYNLLTLIISIIVIVILKIIINSYGIKKYGLIMIFGGALGNLFDRIFYKAVPDFIDFHIGEFHWFVFNVADIFITIGVIIMILFESILNEQKKNEHI